MTFPPLLWEMINLVLANLAVCLAFIFARYLVFEIVKNGFGRMRLRAAIAIIVWAVGESTLRGAAGIGRHMENNGGDVRWILDAPWGFLPAVGAVISAAGMLCVIRVFCPDEWGSWGWVACAIFAAAATVIQVHL